LVGRPSFPGPLTPAFLGEEPPAVKGLDTSALVAILEGDRSSRDLLRRLRGHEIATTELNMLELERLAATGSPRGRGPRRLALERLRRKVTVLPIDIRAVSEAARHLGRKVATRESLDLGVLGALEANGCDEFFTDRRALPGVGWRLKPVRFSLNHPK
jgi:predicted nucleic acid-binding protein